MKPIVSKHRDVAFIGIVKAVDWFSKSTIRKYKIPFISLSYVVGKWFDYHDGVQSHIECQTTLAICRELKDAKILYRHHKI